MQPVTAHRMVAFGEYSDDGTASAMKARDYKDATDLVAQPIPIDMRNAGRDPEKHDEMNRQGVGVGEPGDPAHTVTSAFVQGVAQPMFLHINKGRPAGRQSAHEEMVTVKPIVETLTTDGHARSAIAQPIGWDEELNASVEQSGTLLRGGQGGRHDGVMTQAMQVRRLTPVECERLQGFPDNYTNIPWRKKPESPDGPRYKALGNSWAVPNVHWIGKRIQEALQEAAQIQQST